ncbi:hypothetical protein CULT_460024 [[Clostridium] ultunense Esp]|nr:hypothetical protein CULT_460024 [[Clostridium] ultunense Esp]
MAGIGSVLKVIALRPLLLMVNRSIVWIIRWDIRRIRPDKWILGGKEEYETRMKHVSRKYFFLPIVGIIALFLLSILFDAENIYDLVFGTLKEKWQETKDSDVKVLAEVNGVQITNKDFNPYLYTVRANEQLNHLSPETDQKIWNDYLKEHLLYKEGVKNGFSVSAEQAKAYAEQMRETLAKADSKAQEFQKRIIDSMGVDEETYWNEIAPFQYQKELTVTNYVDSLIRSGRLANPSASQERIKPNLRR